MGAHAMQQPRDMHMAQKESSGMGMAFVLGAAIGAISGLLFAPKSGRETRDDIKHKSDDMNTMAHERIEQAKSKAHDLTDKFKSKADESMDRADDLEIQGKEAMDRLDTRASSTTRNSKL